MEYKKNPVSLFSSSPVFSKQSSLISVIDLIFVVRMESILCGGVEKRRSPSSNIRSHISNISGSRRCIIGVETVCEDEGRRECTIAARDIRATHCMHRGKRIFSVSLIVIASGCQSQHVC